MPERARQTVSCDKGCIRWRVTRMLRQSIVQILQNEFQFHTAGVPLMREREYEQNTEIQPRSSTKSSGRFLKLNTLC